MDGECVVDGVHLGFSEAFDNMSLGAKQRDAEWIAV